MIAAIASAASASPSKKPAAVAKMAPDSNLAVVVSAISGWGYEQSTTPVRVPFGKLTHFDKLSISSFEVRGVMVAGDGLPVPKADKVSAVAIRISKVSSLVACNLRRETLRLSLPALWTLGGFCATLSSKSHGGDLLLSGL